MRFPNQARPVDRASAFLQEVRSPGIMDADALEEGQDPNRVLSVLSSALILLWRTEQA